jgi:hypothetical protein
VRWGFGGCSVHCGRKKEMNIAEKKNKKVIKKNKKNHKNHMKKE